jgi:signal transduction histidine kinase
MCGTTLDVDRLDLGRPADDPGPPSRSELPADRPLQVLHLEDSPSDSALAGEFLESEGVPCELHRVETREEFEAALRSGGLDLILADFQLPAFDGLTAFLLARQLRPEVPFIMLTGKLGEEYAIDTLKLGVTDYVLKQSFTRLAPAVHRALLERGERAQRLAAEEQLRSHREHLEELVLQRTAELEERNAQLAVANRDLEAFAASLTHDLRGPLVVIGGYARRLVMNCAGRIDAADLELLRGVILAEARMERLLDDLLTFFRTSQVAVNRVRIDMEAAAREAFDGVRPLLGERRVTFSHSPLPPALGDPVLIRQVLDNLLANAVKYSAPRDPALIEVSGWDEPDATGYCVRDNGIGFDTRARERIFEIFQRLHDAPEFPGTGVGLATVKRIVEKHGGSIWADGAVGEGASFFFTLPKAGAGRGA